jgi:hypothetical protein
MKNYIANQAFVLNHTRYDKGVTVALTDKQATDLVSSGKISLEKPVEPVKPAAKAAPKNTKTEQKEGNA